MTKPKFGDMKAKEAYVEQQKHRQLFELRVTNAMKYLQFLDTLPPPNSPICEYPGTVRNYSLDVLEEANRRERARRASK